MKTMFLAFALSALLASCAMAQVPEKRNEVSLGIGDAGVIWIVQDAFGEDVSPQFFVGYQRRFGRWAGLGLTASYVDVKAFELTTMAAEARGHWLRRPRVDLYSGLALGVISQTGCVDPATFPAIQLVLFGIRFGGETGGFFESGIGTNGFLKVGFSQRL
jgi:hypothetical protein